MAYQAQTFLKCKSSSPVRTKSEFLFKLLLCPFIHSTHIYYVHIIRQQRVATKYTNINKLPLFPTRASDTSTENHHHEGGAGKTFLWEHIYGSTHPPSSSWRSQDGCPEVGFHGRWRGKGHSRGGHSMFTQRLKWRKSRWFCTSSVWEASRKGYETEEAIYIHICSNYIILRKWMQYFIYCIYYV